MRITKTGGAAVGAARSLLALVLTAAVLATACGRSRPSPLDGSFDSPEALARAVLEGVVAGDRDLLNAYALSEEEFRLLVWPELPAARPERNVPYSYVWKELSQKSNGALRESMARLRGQQLEFLRLDFSGEVSTSESYTVSRGSRIWVRSSDGSQRFVRVFGSMLAHGGRYKVFSYVVD